MAVDPTIGDHGRLHLVWLHATSDPPLGGFGAPPNPIMASYSDDGGNGFSEPVVVSDPARLRVAAPAVTVGPDQTVHVSYYDLKNDVRDYQGLTGPAWTGTWSLVSATSVDGGVRFEPGVEVTSAIIPAERVLLIFTMPPAALAASSSGEVFVGWHDARNGDSDVLIARSDDRGKAWQTPVRVNDDNLRNGRGQYLPELSVAPDGRLDVLFYDRRHDPKNIMNDTYYSYSNDGGRSFTPNLKVTTRSSDTRIGQRYLVPSAEGKFEFGSHPALQSHSRSAVAAWTDTRNASLGTNQQEIFTATVLVDGGSTRGVFWLLPVIAVLAAVALATVVLVRRRGPRDT